MRLLADKGYDSDALIETLEKRGITPVIPPKANRREPRKTDFALYRERNLVERFFCKLKQYQSYRDTLTTNSLTHFLPLSPWFAYCSGSTDTTRPSTALLPGLQLPAIAAKQGSQNPRVQLRAL